jgi:hypothetical protein
MKNEIWKQCGEGKQRIYEASNLGNLRSINKCNNDIHNLKQTTSAHGYNFIKINRKNKFTHHLVAKAFFGERPVNKVVDHIDRDKQNNCVENLRYCTHKENSMNTSRYRHDVVGTPYERNLILVAQRMKKYYYRKKYKLSLINDL